jgi:hypothetical protein
MRFVVRTEVLIKNLRTLGLHYKRITNFSKKTVGIVARLNLQYLIEVFSQMR